MSSHGDIWTCCFNSNGHSSYVDGHNTNRKNFFIAGAKRYYVVMYTELQFFFYIFPLQPPVIVEQCVFI